VAGHPLYGPNGSQGRASRTLSPQVHEGPAQVVPIRCGVPWLSFVVYPSHRLLKRRNAAHFTRRLRRNLDAYQAWEISFAEFDASV